MIMAIQTLKYTITGEGAILINNPQTVDRFNVYSKSMALINRKGTRRTDEDYLELRKLEIKAKLYFDDEMGVYIPATWVTAAIQKISHKQAKIAKADIRGSVFSAEVSNKIKLNYRDMKLVKTMDDVVGNPNFHKLLLLKQGQVKIAKNFPIFHDWSFSGELEFDDTTVDGSTLEGLLKYASRYGGFGDFRPTFGRATAVTEIL